MRAGVLGVLLILGTVAPGDLDYDPATGEVRLLIGDASRG